MNAAVAFHVEHGASTPGDMPRLPMRTAEQRRRRRLSASIAAGLAILAAVTGGIAFAASGDDPAKTSPGAASGSSESETPSARPGRAGPGYVAD